MGNSMYATHTCNGSLALASSNLGFRVIEGGLSNSAKCTSHRAANTHDTSYANHNCDVRKAHADHSQVADLSKSQKFAFSVVAMLAVSLCAIVWCASDILAERRVSEAFSQVSYESIIVHPGDSLWEIAQSHPVAGCSTREVVHNLRTVNGLSSAYLTVGSEILAPSNG